MRWRVYMNGRGNCGCANDQTDAKNTGGNFLSCFFSLPPAQFALLSALLGILLTESLDLDQQNSLGNFIVGVGQSLLVAAAQGQALQSDDQQDQQMVQQIALLKKQICLLEDNLKGRR